MAKRVDANQKEIVKAFRDLGASVQIISMVGKGCPDIIVGYEYRNYLIEIKTPKGLLTNSETDFFLNWKGQMIIIRSIDHVVTFMRSISGDRSLQLPPNNLK